MSYPYKKALTDLAAWLLLIGGACFLVGLVLFSIYYEYVKFMAYWRVAFR